MIYKIFRAFLGDEHPHNKQFTRHGSLCWADHRTMIPDMKLEMFLEVKTSWVEELMEVSAGDVLHM